MSQSQLSELQDTLISVESQNPAVNEEVKAIYEYTDLLAAGKISKEEYTELVLDIQRTLDINKQYIEQDKLNTINTCINGLINAASLI
jgi:polyhydroxyalkanoate synthesis regulator phasin